MPAAYSPVAIRRLSDAVDLESKQLVGILGNAQHFAEGGYHVPRAYCSPGDYSIVLPQDRLGDPYAASAVDWRLSPADMHAATRRLMHACQTNDPRVASVREFFGTVDDVRVIGWDRHNPTNLRDDTPTTSDDSHLWHVHVSFYRQFATNYDAIRAVASVVNGEGIVMPLSQADLAAIAKIIDKREDAQDAGLVRRLDGLTAAVKRLETAAGTLPAPTKVGAKK